MKHRHPHLRAVCINPSAVLKCRHVRARTGFLSECEASMGGWVSSRGNLSTCKLHAWISMPWVPLIKTVHRPEDRGGIYIPIAPMHVKSNMQKIAVSHRLFSSRFWNLGNDRRTTLRARSRAWLMVGVTRVANSILHGAKELLCD